MKKTLLFLTLTIFSFAFSHAQEENKDKAIFGFSKGDIYLSGEFGYDNNEIENRTQKTLNFSPTIGYFLSDHFALNGGITLGSFKSENDITGSTNDNSTTGLTLGATYIFRPKHRFSFTLGLRGIWNKTKIRSPNNTTSIDFENKNFQILLSPGINYFISESIALQVNLGVLSHSKATNGNSTSSDQKTTTFEAGIDFANTGLGIVYKF